jgi:hypothetical protein
VNRGKVAVGYVHPVEVSAYFHDSLIKQFVADFNGPRVILDGGARLPKYSSANVSNARNAIVRTFLDACSAEWLWMVDTDMQWEPEDLYTLLHFASLEKAPVVGGLCFGVEDDFLFPTLYSWQQVEDGPPQTVRYIEYPENAMFQVGATGAAFLLIHRQVLMDVEARGFNKTYPWFQETEIGGKGAGEDVTFCARAQLAGHSVWVHTGVEIGHHKSTLLTAAKYRAQRGTLVTAADGQEA